uniref:dentin sialophosphoprotein-like n=1 Tax=Styela clava TaxID=7725 RepID=UPI00193A6D72|nr:dentin sialophosphoprotein-like [Styela clava]
MKTSVVSACFTVLLALVSASDDQVKQGKFIGENFDDYENTEYDYEGSNVDSENITARFEELSGNADGVEIFMKALELAVMEGEETVKIPIEIDPEEHNISLQDALDRSEQFVTEQLDEAQNLISKLGSKIDEMQMKHKDEGIYTDDTESADSNQRNSDVEILNTQKNEILEIIEGLTDALEDLKEFRGSLAVEDLYSYYYDEDLTEEFDEENDDSSWNSEDSSDSDLGKNGVILVEENSTMSSTEYDNLPEVSDGFDTSEDGEENNTLSQIEEAEIEKYTEIGEIEESDSSATPSASNIVLTEELNNTIVLSDGVGDSISLSESVGLSVDSNGNADLMADDDETLSLSTSPDASENNELRVADLDDPWNGPVDEADSTISSIASSDTMDWINYENDEKLNSWVFSTENTLTGSTISSIASSDTMDWINYENDEKLNSWVFSTENTLTGSTISSIASSDTMDWINYENDEKLNSWVFSTENTLTTENWNDYNEYEDERGINYDENTDIDDYSSSTIAAGIISPIFIILLSICACARYRRVNTYRHLVIRATPVPSQKKISINKPKSYQSVVTVCEIALKCNMARGSPTPPATKLPSYLNVVSNEIEAPPKYVEIKRDAKNNMKF